MEADEWIKAAQGLREPPARLTDGASPQTKQKANEQYKYIEQ